MAVTRTTVEVVDPTPTSGKRYHVGAELKERILACLYLNKGAIEDPGGRATTRLHRLMVTGGVTLSGVRGAVLGLEQMQLILRDIRGGHGGGPIPNAGSRCYGIFMVDQDRRPEQWALDELQEQIDHRLLGKIAKAEAEAKAAGTAARKARVEAEAVTSTTVTTSTEPAGPLELPVVDPDDLGAVVASSLLSQLLDLISNPRQVEVRTETTTVTVPDPEADVLRERLASVQANLDTVVAACKDQEHEIDRLKREVRDLKSQLGRHRGQGDHLTQRVRDVLTPEQLAALQRQAPKDHD